VLINNGTLTITGPGALKNTETGTGAVALTNNGAINTISGTSEANIVISTACTDNYALVNNKGGTIGTIENAEINGIQVTGTAWSEGDTWDTFTSWTIGTIKDSIITSNSGVDGAVYMDESGTIGAISNTTITGQTHGIYFTWFGYGEFAGIGSLSATVEGKSGSAIYLNTSSDAKLYLNIDGGRYKSSDDNAICNNSLKGATLSGNISATNMEFAATGDGYYEYEAKKVTVSTDADTNTTEIKFDESAIETDEKTGETTATVPTTTTVEEKQNVVIDVVTSSGSSSETEATKPTNVIVSIPTEVVSQMNEKQTTELIVKTDVAEVSFDQAALGIIATNAGSDANVKLQTKSVEKSNLEEAQQKVLKSESATIIDLSLTDGTNDIKFNDDTKGTATVKVPFELGEHEAADYAVYYISDDGTTKTKMDCSWDGGYMSFTATHFSTYVIALIADEEAAESLTNVTVTTHDGNVSGLITVTKAETGRTFTVTCANACVVAYTTDNGESYTRMTATKVDDAENTYSFTVDSEVDLTKISIAVALKGDIDLSGAVNGSDAYDVRRAAAGYEVNATVLGSLAADVDANGQINGSDAYDVRRAAAGYNVLSW
jgi:hypothetical protein